MSRATIGWGAVVGLLVAALLATSAAPASGQDAPEGDDGAAAVGASALAPILQYTGGTPLDAAGASFPGLQTFDALADATHRDVVTAATLPADLAAYRCVVLNGMTAPYGNGDMAALSAYVQGGGTLVTTAESDGIPGGPDTQAVQNQLLAALGSVVENLHGAEDLGFRTTGTIAADPLTAGVDEVRYGNTGVLSAGAPARPLVTGEGGQVILAAEALGAGTLVVASDMNVLSDRSDTGYVSQDNGRLADNLCGGVGFLSGTVWEEGFGDMVAGVHVAVLRTSDFSIAAGDISSTPHGHFDVALDVGSYFLYLIDPSGRHVSGFFGPPTTIDVAAGELETAQPTMAPARGSLSGTVTDDATAAPVPGAWAVAIGPDGIAGATVTAGDGTYTLPHLAPGTYRATFADPAGGRLQEYYDDQPDYDGASPLPVTVGATTGDVDAALAAGPGRGTAAVDVVAGGSHSCALLDDGSVKCWGANGSGQLGLGDVAARGDGAGEMGDALPVVDLGAGRSASAVVAGAEHSCALLDDGSVKCWGANGSGQLGLGDVAARGDGAGEMGDALPVVDLGAGRSASAVVAGAEHTCALLDGGSLGCWGANLHGQSGYQAPLVIGDGAGEMGDDLPLVALGTGRTVVAVTASDVHTCAVLDNDTLKCWGENGDGRLGLGDTTDRGSLPGTMAPFLPTVALGTGRSPTRVSAGGGHTCAVLDDASVRCWGGNGGGRLGLGDTAARGDGAGEMGDALPAVLLATVRSVGGTALGLQTLQAVPGAMVAFLRTSDLALAGGAVGDAGGAFQVDLRPGSYFAYLIDPTGLHVPGFSGDAGGPTVIEVPQAGPVPVAEVAMSLGRGFIAGTVTDDATGDPLAGAWVFAIGPAGITSSGVTAVDGSYVLPWLPAVPHVVTFVDVEGGRGQEYWDDSADYGGATPIVITAAELVDGVDAGLGAS